MGNLTLEHVRKLITGKSTPLKSIIKEMIDPDVQSKYFTNQSRTNSGLEPYTGTWGNEEILHLLKRTTFGPTLAQKQSFEAMTRVEIVDSLLVEEPAPLPPINVSEEDTSVAVGETWINVNDGFENNFFRVQSLVAWWMGHIVDQKMTLREKMTLFWSNHFVTEIEIVEEARVMYHYVSLLRENALGNFKDLAKNITSNAAMLIYLNGDANEVGAANENFARELFELFSIGKGQQIGEGDYTHYTEQDVLAAARVLTGWKVDWLTATSYFNTGKHDTGDKQFSSAFDNQVIKNNGEQEIDDLIEMIFSKKETARFLCRKLYRWFVYYHIDDTVEQNVIEPLATILYDQNYDIKPVLLSLFNSAHFYDVENRGCMIKNPLDFTANLIRQFEIEFPPADQFVTQYNTWLFTYYLVRLQEMTLGSPPGVAGWPAYYQEPQFHRIWVNSATLPFKRDLSNFFALTPGYAVDGFQLWLNPLTIADKTSVPGDPDVLVQELIDLIFPIDLNQDQKDFLKNVLIPGLPDFEWTVEWNDYKSDPENQEKLLAVGTKLQALYSTMLTMAEYQLA